jgi:hypothetical protein
MSSHRFKWRVYPGATVMFGLAAPTVARGDRPQQFFAASGSTGDIATE